MGSADREDPELDRPSWMKSAGQQLDDVARPLVPEVACTAAPDDPCKDSKDTVANAFSFMQGFVSVELDKLARELKTVDKPSWQEALLEHCLDVALAVGGARVGEFIVERVGHEFTEHAKAAAEFIKKSLEEGAPKGTKAGMAKLEGKSVPNVDEFVDAQKVGVMAMYQNAAASFISSGRHELQTSRDATALSRSLDSPHLISAARRQHDASRDAYLACLAQQTLGATKDGTTAMDGHGASGHEASVSGAMLGIDTGILVAQVLAYDDVKREPGVWGSYLNGVNDVIREQYEDRPLSTIRIPRQLICSVRGDMQDFVVNVDETGAMELVWGDGVWLEARARATNPGLAMKPRVEQRRIGLELLLDDLRIAKIGHGGFR